MTYYVYILASQPNGTLYIGVTNDLIRRVWEHREKVADGFTKKYKVHRLVYFEEYPTAAEAIHREKCMKEWKRAWKVKCIREMNPEWDDLYEKIQA